MTRGQIEWYRAARAENKFWCTLRYPQLFLDLSKICTSRKRYKESGEYNKAYVYWFVDMPWWDSVTPKN